MGARVKRLLKIHSGEESDVGRLLVLMFSVWMAATIGSSGIESLLFSRYGPHALPYLFIVIAPVTLPITASLGALLQRADRHRTLALLPTALAIVLLLGRALMLTHNRLAYPVLWLVMMLVWIMEATGAWAVASLVNDTRQAKRLFPLYGAGQIVGGAAGGLLTVPLARLLHAENLVFIWIVALVGASVLIRALLDAPPQRLGRSQRRQRTNVLASVIDGLRRISSSKLLAWLAVAMVLFAMLYNSLSFIFADALTARFEETDTLAAFIGFFNAVINAGGLVVSLLIANRLFARFGVPTMVLTLGAIYLLGFTGLSAGAGFGVLVAFRLIQMIWVNGVWITGWQALFTIVPSERRGQVTSFMDGVAWEAGMMVAGAAILLAEALRGDRAVPLLGIAGATLLLFAMWRARRAYGPAVAEAVRSGRPEVFVWEEEPFGGFRTDATAIAALAASAADEDVEVRRIAVAIAGDLRSSEALPAVLRGAEDDDPEVKVVAFRSLAANPDPSAAAPAMSALSHPDAAVRASAVDALVACSPGDAGTTVPTMLDDPDPSVRARAALGLIRTGSPAEGRERLTAMLHASNADERAAALTALGELGDGEELLLAAIDDEEPLVRRAALQALSPPQAPTRRLVQALGDPDVAVRDAAVDAISALGNGAVKELEAALFEPRLETGALHLLRGIGSPESELLRTYARDQVARATHFGLLVLRLGDGPDDRVALLQFALRSLMAQHATNALWANAAWEESRRLHAAIEGLANSRGDQRATALEAIDSLGDPQIVRPILAMWEQEPARRSDARAVVDELLAEEDVWLRACAVVATESFPGMFEDRLEQIATTDPDPEVRTAALSARARKAPVETLDTLPLMTRVLFLRKVDLFMELAPADLKGVATAAGENFFTDGEIIAEEGEPGGEMHVVVSGEIEVERGQADDQMELARRGAGEVVGEMSLITGEPRMASLIARGDVRTLSIDQSRFERILFERPQVSMAVMRQLCARLTQSMETVARQ